MIHETPRAAGEKQDRNIPFQEALRRIGVSRSTGYRLIERGLLPNTRVGKRRFVRESVIERILVEGAEG